MLVGAGGFGRVVLEHASLLYDCAFLDDGNSAVVDDVPVIGNTADLEKLYGEYKLLLVTIASAYVSPRAILGTGIIILNNAVVQNNSRIGNGCILNPGVEAHHDSTIGNYCLIYTNSVIRSLTHLGDRVWIGSTATISTGAAIPNDSIVPDGSVFEKNS